MYLSRGICKSAYSFVLLGIDPTYDPHLPPPPKKKKLLLQPMRFLRPLLIIMITHHIVIFFSTSYPRNMKSPEVVHELPRGICQIPPSGVHWFTSRRWMPGLLTSGLTALSTHASPSPALLILCSRISLSTVLSLHTPGRFPFLGSSCDSFFSRNL